ncbi:MAG: hypothetical protein FD121_75 [Gallionellaceae bacterium]|nr:MAG: hypothetical protein FD121_75 [Gallionellaceae bacterium]
MKKLLVLAVALGISQPAMAGTVNLAAIAGAANQGNFRNLSHDLGSALSYKAISPAESMGITGFDVGVELTSTKLAKSAPLWKTLTGTDMNNLYVPKLHVTKGLPLDIDIGAFASSIPTTGINLFGGELKYAVLPGSVAMPAVAIRGSLSKLSGVKQLSLDTKSVDVSISKGFAMFTPYAGVGQVWVTSTPDAALGLTEEKFKHFKSFIGANMNFGLTNFAAEFDETGSAKSLNFKLGFRF